MGEKRSWIKHVEKIALAERELQELRTQARLRRQAIKESLDALQKMVMDERTGQGRLRLNA